MKKIWRKNFSASRVGLHMVAPAIADMMLYQHKITGKLLISELVFIQTDYECLAAYIPVNQLRRMVDFTMKLIQEKPELIDKVHKQMEKHSIDYFKSAKSIAKINYSKLADAQLGKIYDKLNHLQMLSHGTAIATTWFVDSDGEDLSKFLMEQVEAIIRRGDSRIAHARHKLSVPEVFSILTTPDNASMAIKEEIESLEILKLINKNLIAKKIFLLKDIEKIEKNLDKINPSLRQKIINHYKKWRWTSYTYIGPAYDLDYYLTMWSGLLKEKINIDTHLSKVKNYSKRIRAEKAELFKNLIISPKDKKLFDIAADIIYLKAFRKDVWFYGCFIMEGIHKEIAKRLGLSLKQVRFFAFWEVAPALKKREFSANILNERIKYSVYYQKGKVGKIFIGKKAKDFLAKLNIEKEEIKEVDELSGTCASPGKVKGIVKLVSQPDEMGKMNKGDVMVAHTTFPALVTAMKKAAAIITDDGGITCHAAIVARELKTPCVVGTKIATKVLKDGDRVEVDANKGVVRKL